MRFEKLDLASFESPVLEGIAGRSWSPPSLLPENDQIKIPSAPPPPPTFNEQQLKAAEQEGYRKGFLEGTGEGKMQAQSEQAEVERQLAAVVEQLAERIHEIFRSHHDFIKQQKQYLPPLALSIARKVAGKALAEDSLPLIESVVTPCVERVLGEPKIVVTVGEALATTLEGKLTAHFANNNDPGEISVNADATMSAGDCRIEWTSGKAERNTETLWQQMEAIISDMVLSGHSGTVAAPAATGTDPATSLRDAIGDAPLIDPTTLNDINTKGE